MQSAAELLYMFIELSAKDIFIIVRMWTSWFYDPAELPIKVHFLLDTIQKSFVI